MTDRPFDISVKDLAEQDPLSWSRLGETRSVDRAEIIDADISTVTASADKVLRVYSGAHEWLVNLEAVSSHDSELPGRLHLKSVMLEARHRLPVRSVVLLLRREANARAMTGTLQRRMPNTRRPYNIFRYERVRLWQMPLQPLLAGGLGTLPLAALTDEARPQLSAVVQQINARFYTEVAIDIADKGSKSLFLLLGLRYDTDLIHPLFEGLKTMKDSSTYRWLVEQEERISKAGREAGLKAGRLEEARRAIVLVGEPKFGPTTATTKQRLEAVSDPSLLEQLLPSVHTATTWEELLAPLPS